MPTKGAFYEADTRAEQNPQTLHPQGLTQTLAKGQRPRRGWALFPASLVPLQSPRAATRKPRTWGGGEVRKGTPSSLHTGDLQPFPKCGEVGAQNQFGKKALFILLNR